ncbi:uncharacterized protein LOC132613313 [Lycium barbarum]|uniref:uncharacterized protein LOC132613313 n=1 Tax=Lycium barbarum TaxID=112863 RepID=UPI00293F4642|nr:uncharacterized protein LOC132613313 [Lycium barbarum]
MSTTENVDDNTTDATITNNTINPPPVGAIDPTVTASHQVDACHPYFLTSSDNPGINLISFDGTSYGNWRRGVLISLSAKNKLGFINGACRMPPSNSPLLEQWKRCNDMVIAWLLNSLSRDINESVIYSQTAEELWNELEERYGQADGTKLFQLQRELNSISQGSSDAAGYFTKIKRIWDQLKPILSFYTKRVKERFILILLQLQSLLLSSTLLDRNGTHKIIHKVTPKYSGNQKQTNSSVYGGNKDDLFCRYCKKIGHLKEAFYRLIGYPAHYKISKEKKQATQHANAAVAGQAPDVSADAISTLITAQGFSKGQCEQLIHMFKSMQGRSKGSNSESIATANLAGTNHACLLFTSFLSKITNSPWILDTGATQHMTFKKNLLHDIRVLPSPISVHLANSHKVKAYSMGSLVLTPELDLHGVLYVSDFTQRQLKFDLLFTEDGCILQEPSLRKGSVFGDATGGLYMLRENTSTLDSKATKYVVPVSSISVKNKSRILGSSPCFSESSCEKATCPVLLSPVCDTDSILKTRSPHQVLFGKEPDYSYLKPFGCLCFSSTLARQRDKLTPRALPAVFLGYPFGQKGYKVLNLQNGTIHISRNVKFIETTFPFSYGSPMSKLFPVCFPSSDGPALDSGSHPSTTPHSSPITTPSPPDSPIMSSTPDPTIFTSSSSFPTPTQVEVLPTASEEPPRRSQRVHVQPKYLSDYICDSAFSVISSNPPLLPFYHFSFFAMSSQNQSIISSTCQISNWDLLLKLLERSCLQAACVIAN